MQFCMDHIVLNVDDIEEMLMFYSGILLFQTDRLEEYRAGVVPFPSVRLNPETVIDLFPKQLWKKDDTAGQGQGQGQGHLNHFCIAMDKETWNGLFERLRDNNITIEEGPVPRWGAQGNGTSIYFRDPEGTLVEARYYEGRNDSEECLLGS